MKKRILSILSKAPMPKGRIGPHYKQDWHASCKLLAREMAKDKHAIALLITGLRLDGICEMDEYHGALRRLGVCEKRIISIHEGLETMHQLVCSKEEAERRGRDLVFVLTAIHLIRTKFLCMVLGIRATFIVAYGIPRPKDVLSEILLFPIYPLFFSPRFRQWFQGQADERRKSGKL